MLQSEFGVIMPSQYTLSSFDAKSKLNEVIRKAIMTYYFHATQAYNVSRINNYMLKSTWPA
jgi:hypothetical protein